MENTTNNSTCKCTKKLKELEKQIKEMQKEIEVLKKALVSR